ncbi:hypothetical protein ACM66B_000994 [Microbotryomycetes sp. NB124-2]
MATVAAIEGELGAQRTNERVIRPLPKRQRLAENQTSSSVPDRAPTGRPSRKGVTKSTVSAIKVDEDPTDEDDEERSHQEHERLRAMQLHSSSNSTLPALQDRSRHDDDDYRAGLARTSSARAPASSVEDGSDAAAAAVHFSKLKLDDSSYDTDDNHTARTSLEPSISSTQVDNSGESPFTSPAGSNAGGAAREDSSDSKQQRKHVESLIERRPTDFALFGDEGILVRKALVNAHLYSSAGLCGGLGLAGLHPALPQFAELTTGPTVAAHVGQHDEDVDEDPDSKYDARPVGSNKKKRKIPGMSLNGPADDVEGPHYDVEDGPEPTTVVGPDRKGRAPGGVSRLKAPTNPPKTAKAALAKLRIKPPHVSSCSLCLSHRRHLREVQRRAEKQPPLELDPPSTFYPPPVPKDGPPPLPPGSGLKGSKALKAAKKAEKERQKEKERMRVALGGPDLKLIDLYDPLGFERERKKQFQATSVSLSRSNFGPFLPPDDFDGFELDGAPVISNVMDRWDLLQDQIEQLASAKRRAKEARDMVQERRREQERESASQAASLDGHDAAPPGDSGGSREALPIGTTAAAAAATTNELSTDPGASAAAQAPPAADDSATTKPRRNSKVSPTTYTQEAPQPLSTKKTGGSKKGKKKRSAHANALNVHHRNNYVPSRAPASSSSQHQLGRGGGVGSVDDADAGMFWPPSDEALAAAGGSRGDLSWFSGPDEWLCALCEYDLLFGDVDKAVKQRRKVLKVRRKAKQRASKATAGAIAGATSGGLSSEVTGSASKATADGCGKEAVPTAPPPPPPPPPPPAEARRGAGHETRPWTSSTQADPVE